MLRHIKIIYFKNALISKFLDGEIEISEKQLKMAK